MDLMYLSFKEFDKSLLDSLDPSMECSLKIVDYSKESDVKDKIDLHTKVFNPNYDLDAHINSLKLSYSEGNGFGIFFYLNGDLVGALDVERTNDFVYIMNFGLIPELRGKGLGRRFIVESLATIIDKIGSKFDGIYLLVSKKNICAKTLYESLGFEVKI